MLDFDFKKLEFKVNGVVHSIEYPTVKTISSFRNKLKAEGADEVEETISFISSLGVEKEVVESLRVSQLTALVNELTNETAKKN